MTPGFVPPIYPFDQLIPIGLDGLRALIESFIAVGFSKFVVRPILVPAYLILLNKGFFGPLGPLLGAHTTAATAEPLAVAGKH